MEGLSKNEAEGGSEGTRPPVETLPGNAKEPMDPEKRTSSFLAEQLVCFLWGDRQMGIPIAQVKETLALRPLTRVFLTPRFVLGVVNVRGDILAVLDLASLMGLPPLHYGGDAKIVVVQSQRRRWGVLVDSMTGVRDCPQGSLSQTNNLLPQAPPWLAGVLTGEDGAPVGILDMSLLLETEALRKLLGDEDDPPGIKG